MSRKPALAPIGLETQGWPLVRLGTCFTHKDTRSVTGSERLLSITKVRGVVPRDSITDKEPRAESLVGYKLCQRGDLVVNQMSVYDGLLGISPMDGLVTYHYLVFRPSPDIDARYFSYLLKTEIYRGDFSQRVRGLGDSSQANVRTPHIRIGDFLRTIVPLPPLQEQRRIADFLDDQVTRIDHAIQLRREQRTVIRARETAWIDSTVAAEFRRFGGRPMRRYVKSIEQGWSPVCHNAPATVGQPGVLKLGAVRDGVFDPSQNKAMQDGVAPVMRYALREGDLLMSRANTPDLVGDVAVVPQEFPSLFLSDLIYRIRLSGALTEFVAITLRGSDTRGLLKVTARGTSQTMVKLRGDDIRKLLIPDSPIPEQERVVSEHAHLQRTNVALEQNVIASATTLIERKQSLTTAALTGEFDVTSASSRAAGVLMSGGAIH